jgi:hypothetical protein
MEEMMRIYIPSRGRATITKTFSNLPPAVRKNAVYVVPKDEVAAYEAEGYPVISPPPSVNRIAVTRQWIVEYHLTHHKETDKLCMLDDDLSFHYRVPDGGYTCSTGGRAPDHKPIVAGFAQLERLLNSHAHAGIHIKFGSNYIVPGELVRNRRVCRAIAFRASILKKHWPRTKFGVVPVQDDFDMTLSLLELGYPNVIVTDIVQEQTGGGSGSVGGASTYRDMKYHADSVHKLHARHPEFVKVVKKHTKVAWKGEERIDVVVAWKKALAAGQAKFGIREVRSAK